jgi:two-component system, LuxR family, sensor kinase FixL
MTFKVNIATFPKYSSEVVSESACTDISKITGETAVAERKTQPDNQFSAYIAAPSLRSSLQNSPEAFVVTSLRGNILMFNRRAQNVFGYCEGEVCGQTFASLMEPGFQLKVASIGAFKPDPSVWTPVSCGHEGIRARRKNGELFPVEIQKNRSTHAGESVYVYYIRDASLTLRHEQRIAELEREIAHLSRHSILGELATSITHELSQPLTAITNYTAAASRCRSQDATAEELADSIDLIARAGEQAKRAWLIMHKLRQLLQHRGSERSEGDLRSAVEDAVQLATLGAAGLGIAVAVELPSQPVCVLMDRVQVQVLLANLIRNAVDELSTTEGERKIWIRLSVNEQLLAELAVEDTGHGITPEVFENIFDPFHTTKAEGLGVGLALSRRIAQAHGGRLSVANRPGGGAIFSFVVPVV